MRDAALAVTSQIGVETGGSTPVRRQPRQRKNGRIEMNRASRAPRAASKATGFPMQNSRETSCRLHARRNSPRHHPQNHGCFEPTSIRSSQIPSGNLKNFGARNPGHANESVGEVMASAAPQESLLKAIRAPTPARNRAPKRIEPKIYLNAWSLRTRSIRLTALRHSPGNTVKQSPHDRHDPVFRSR